MKRIVIRDTGPWCDNEYWWPSDKLRCLMKWLVFAALGSFAAAIAIIVLISSLHEHHECARGHRSRVARDLTVSASKQYAAVVSDGIECSRVGRTIFEQNGSAVDAAIATLLCESVACPQSQGLGGGFIATIYTKSTGRAETINTRELAPLASHEHMFANRTLIDGPQSIAVPGTIKGYWEMHQRYGRLPWATLFRPAIAMCAKGSLVNPLLAGILAGHQHEFELNTNLGAVFLDPKTGHAFRYGDRIPRPQLAATLEILAAEGPAALHVANGTLLRMVMRDLTAVGSILTEADFTGYEARWLPAESVALRNDLRLYTSSLPGTGFLVAFIVKVMEGFAMDESPLTFHRVVETFKYAFASRTKMGDPLFEDGMRERVDELLSDENVAKVRGLIEDDRTYQEYQHYGGVYSFKMDRGTANMNVLAPNGDAVSVTSSLNNYFGSKVISPQTGIIFNNQLDDFSVYGITNVEQVLGTPRNHMKPKKQPMSSASPTIIVGADNNVRMVIGAAGGSKIISAVSMVIMRYFMLNQSLAHALEAPRLHHLLMPVTLYHEKELAEDVQDGLRERGHILSTEQYPGGFGSITVIVRDAAGNVLAMNDPRRIGSSEVISI